MSEPGANADGMLAGYRKSRPEASPTDLYIAITTARMIGIGAITIAERKYSQHGAPVYMYIFRTNQTISYLEHSTKRAPRKDRPPGCEGSAGFGRSTQAKTLHDGDRGGMQSDRRSV